MIISNTYTDQKSRDVMPRLVYHPLRVASIYSAIHTSNVACFPSTVAIVGSPAFVSAWMSGTAEYACIAIARAHAPRIAYRLSVSPPAIIYPMTPGKI